jgi:steroid 5-alpha reductase family enzyme
VAIAYLVALGAAVALGFVLADMHVVWMIALCDLLATVAVFGFSVGCDNTSVYDPYWSVAPVPIALAFALHPAAEGADVPRQIIVVLLVSVYGIRLTFNWIRRWTGLAHEDWRYAGFRRTGRWYWPVSFLGFHLMPTATVFLACLSLVPALLAGARPFGLVDVAAVVVTAGAILIEAIADRQLARFLAAGPAEGETLTTGLWAYARHPNYLGEVAFWWGLYLFGLAADPGWWWTVAGPVWMTALFVFISIPMIDKRMLARRPGDAERMRTTPALVPWFRKKKEA